MTNERNQGIPGHAGRHAGARAQGNNPRARAAAPQPGHAQKASMTSQLSQALPMLEVDEMAAPMAVSYTHLDVSKRQEQEQVLAAGGLCVIGTERHESRRIDNQLRGRSGRQGDPGVTQFYLSLEDDLMRLFGGSKMDSIAHMMEKTNQEDDMPIQAGMVSKSIESAQRQVESMHFAARKNVLELSLIHI